MNSIAEGRWNEDFWSREQSRTIKGICAVLIIFHHMAQKTCAPWLPEQYTVHGLEPFLQTGYLLVGVFFFCSGFGLYLSVKEKPDYLDGFIGRHYRPIILVFIIANVCYFLVGNEFSSYNWYVYAILYLYAAFCISFKAFKRDCFSISVLAAITAFYVLICELAVTGTWCYNTVGVFLVGILFAKYRQRIAASIRQRYKLCLAVLFCLLTVTFLAGVRVNNSVGTFENAKAYNTARFGAVLLQFISAELFSIFLFALNQKLRIKCRALELAGTLCFELYMAHVIFVEAFSFSFGSIERSVFYIRNLFFYIAAVLVLSAASAYALSLIKNGAHYTFSKYNDTFSLIERDAKKAIQCIIIAMACVTVFLAVKNAAGAAGLKAKAEEYRNKYITFTHAGDENIAFYMSGEGEKAVLVIRGNYDPCPTLSRKALADELAEDFLVVVPDLPGTGFSPESKSKRSVENICREIHSVAAELELKNYILLAEGISCLYAQYYVDRYPREVSKVVTLDAETAGIGRAFLDKHGISVSEYRRQERKAAALSCLGNRLACILGYNELIWPLYEDMYMHAAGWENEDAAKQVFFSSRAGKAIFGEKCCETDAYLAAEELTYPEDIEVIDFVSEGRIKDYEKRGIIITGQLDALSSRCRNHRIVNLVDCSYCVLYNPEVIRNNLR